MILGLQFVAPSSWAQEVVPFRGSEPVEITAEKLEYFKDEDRFVAKGSVKIIRGNLRLTSDYAELDNKSRWLTAQGQVDLYDGESHLTGDWLKYNLDTDEGVFLQGTLFVEKEHFYLESEQIEKLSGDRYRFEAGSLTTCDFKEGQCPLWQIRARRSRMKLDGYLFARDVVFEIKGVPVFYLPYLIMPVKTTRQTGFLVPRVGYNTNEGLKINEDFFWAIASNQDATFSLDYRSGRGIGGGLEYRYLLDRESGGTITTRYFNDRIAERQRWEGSLQHRQVFSQDLQARLNVRLVNDVTQFRDLSEVTEERVKRSLDSSFILYHRWDEQYLYLLAFISRDLLPDSNVTLRRETVKRLPEIGYRIPGLSLGGLPIYFELEATATNFWVDEEQKDLELVRALRLDFFPRLTGRFHLTGLVVTPRVGFRETWYSRGLDLDEDSPANRSVGVFDVGANTRFFKTLLDSPDRNLKRLVHYVEPAVKYEYVPRVDQEDLPKFDEVDQLPVKNLVTYSLTNRWVGHLRGSEKKETARREWVRVKITQSYDVREKRLGLGRSNGPARPFSNVRSEVIVRPHATMEVDLDSFYNLYEKQIVMINTDLKTRIIPYVLLSVGQRLTREGTALPIGDVLNPLSQSNETFWYTEVDSPMIRFFTTNVRVDFPFGLSLANRIFYDADAKDFAEIDYGLQYDGQCWAASVSYIDLPEENQFSFMITLKTAGPTQSKNFMTFFD